MLSAAQVKKNIRNSHQKQFLSSTAISPPVIPSAVEGSIKKCHCEEAEGRRGNLNN
jgi:hypothetical protein